MKTRKEMTMRLRDMVEPDTGWIERELRKITALPDIILNLDQCGDLPDLLLLPDYFSRHIEPMPYLEEIVVTEAYKQLEQRFAALGFRTALVESPWMCYVCSIQEVLECFPIALRLECRRAPSDEAGDILLVEFDELSLRVPQKEVAAAKTVILVLLYRFELPLQIRNDLIQAYETVCAVPGTPPLRLHLRLMLQRRGPDFHSQHVWDLVLDGDTIALSAEGKVVEPHSGNLIRQARPIRATEGRDTRQGEVERWLQPLEEVLAHQPPAFRSIFEYASVALQVTSDIAGTDEHFVLYRH
jgi:hypothetical protein